MRASIRLCAYLGQDGGAGPRPGLLFAIALLMCMPLVMAVPLPVHAQLGHAVDLTATAHQGVSATDTRFSSLADAQQAAPPARPVLLRAHPADHAANSTEHPGQASDRAAGAHHASRLSMEQRWPDGYVAVCAVVKDQRADLRYWLEWYRALGVGRVYLYDHNSTWPLAGLLTDYLHEGFVEYNYFVGALLVWGDGWLPPVCSLIKQLMPGA